MILANTVEINGQSINKERFGFAATDDNYKTFTGDVLFTSQKAKKGWSQSIEEKFNDAKVLGGVVYWKSNGAIPFADMILDFVQIDAISMDIAEATITARQKDDSNFWEEYGLPVEGDTSGTKTKNEAVRRAFERRDEVKARMQRIEIVTNPQDRMVGFDEDDNDWFEDGSCFDEVC